MEFRVWCAVAIDVKKLGNLYILFYLDYLDMPTLLVKNVSEDLLRKLRKLKVELGCRTWAELLEKLVEHRRMILVSGVSEEDVEKFLELRDVVSERWRGRGVLEEFRRSRKHGEASNS